MVVPTGLASGITVCAAPDGADSSGTVTVTGTVLSTVVQTVTSSKVTGYQQTPPMP
jgi:hypothetical protein